MAIRTLKQITSQLNNADQGTIKSIQDRQNLIPQKLADEEAGLQARQTDAFGEILGGARNRGLGFSGIPLGEQAKYTASTYMPALANLRRSGREEQMSLTDAILGIRSGNAKAALGLRQQDQDRAEQRRQFNANLAMQREQARASRAAAGGGGFSPSMGALLGGSQGGNQNAPKIPKGLEKLYNRVFVKPQGGLWDEQSLVNDYNPTLQSAKFGNKQDMQKIKLYHSARPDLFGPVMPRFK